MTASEDEILNRHSISDLEAAETRLRSHISKRRPKPPLPRRLIGLCFSIPAIAAGIALLAWSILTGHLIGLPAIIGPVLIAGGIMWIYGDWFEARL